MLLCHLSKADHIFSVVILLLATPTCDCVTLNARYCQAEIKRRSDSDRQMQAHFDSELKALQEKLAGTYTELSTAFKTSLEGLARTVQDLHAIIK